MKLHLGTKSIYTILIIITLSHTAILFNGKVLGNYRCDAEC